MEVSKPVPSTCQGKAQAYSLNIYSPPELVQQSWELRQKQVKGQMSASRLGRKREGELPISPVFQAFLRCFSGAQSFKQMQGGPSPGRHLSEQEQRSGRLLGWPNTWRCGTGKRAATEDS
ncbi:uncharacterized protein LOC116418709 isoform X2 [Piliocolobus tephrosceles]|uniref:uncharacterized protein LOC116418709 isoform X2 n=1 Tax=Piliocolobus tephrosceles TaxID=591936 RepID=UPI00130144E3|nr:uncharacterized protein LOC116418709 isoform X2 [Piliocolobus tephrosceles]